MKKKCFFCVSAISNIKKISRGYPFLALIFKTKILKKRKNVRVREVQAQTV